MQIIKRFVRYVRLMRNIIRVKRSKLFDEKWYLDKNLDVTQKNINAISHYIQYGGFEERDPSSRFSSAWYLNMYDDVKQAGINPLVHYLKYGKKEGRITQPQQIKSQQNKFESKVNEEMSSLPLSLTVIIFTYNHEDYIAKAIDSVLEQETTYPYEIWLCDDCSTDSTLTICIKYAKKYPDKIKLFAQPVNTYSSPDKVNHVEIALKRVNTKYFCILDGDDAWCDKNKIQCALDILEKNPEYITFAHDTIFNDIVNQTKKSLVHEIYNTEIQNPVTLEKNVLYLHTSSRIHRNVVKFSKNPDAYADIFLFYIFLDKGPLYYHDEIMSVYNITGRGSWSGMSGADVKKANAIQLYKINKFINYKYDAFFTERIGEIKTLEFLKKIFGKKLGWKLWYIFSWS